MFPLLYPFVHALQPLLVPICLVAAWAIVVLTVWSLVASIKETADRTRQLHQIPCSQCQYFTSSYHLKCTVHPTKALTEEAIHCADYAAKLSIYQTKE